MSKLRIREVKCYELPFSELPRPVYWFNEFFPAGTWANQHAHEKWGELVYVSSGKMAVCSPRGNFLVPPHCMVWIPPGLTHEWYLPDVTNDRSLFISPTVLPPEGRFKEQCVLSVSPLVRELIMALADIPPLYEPGPDARLVQTLLDQLVRLPQAQFSLPLPTDRRLLHLCAAILQAPSLSKTLLQWSEEIGMSERTLARRFFMETGETFGKWRSKVRLLNAMERLQTGESVTAVSLSCGYSSVSAFIVAFKRMHGVPPGLVLGQSANRMA